MENKTIVVVSKSLSNNGAERVLSELIRIWVAEGYQLIIVQTAPVKENATFDLPKDVQFHNIEKKTAFKPIRFIQESISLVKILKKYPRATALSFLSAPSFVLAISSLFTNNRVILSERNDPQRCPPDKIQNRLRNLAFRFADACVFQTDQALNYFPPTVRKKGTIIPNPVKPDLPYRIEGRSKVIMTACRLAKQKNLPMLIDAFEKIHREHPDYTLEIYGKGEEEQTIKNIIKCKKLENAVKLKGFSNDIHSVMQKAEIYVCSSDYEGISNSILEAMCIGMPVISTDCPVGGSKMVIQNKVNGLLTPVGDSQALYGAIKLLIENDVLYNTISRNAVAIRDQYPISVINKRWLKVLFPEQSQVI